MSAINSRFSIKISIIEQGKSDHGCAFFAQGSLQKESEVESNLLYRVNIRSHKCKSSLVKVVNSEVQLQRVRFMDNEVSSGGTNGIICINAKLNMIQVEQWYSTRIFKESISSRVGFLTILEDSEVILSKSEFQFASGVRAGAIYSRGANLITITDTDFENSITQQASGALIDIEGARHVNITFCDFYKIEGAPAIRVENSQM